MNSRISVFLTTQMLIINWLPGRRIKGSIVLVLAGNNKVGACGVAAARHLLNRGCHVVVCLGEQSSKLCKVVQRQVSMLKSFGGRVIDNVKGQTQPSYRKQAINLRLF